MLFFVTWPDRISLLIDQADEAAARAVARDIAEGDEPRTCRPFDRLFVAEVFLDDEDVNDPLLVVEPLEHVADALHAFEEESEDAAEVIELPIRAAPTIAPTVCGFELEDGGRVYVCHREPHDDDRHEADDGDGNLVEWNDAGG